MKKVISAYSGLPHQIYILFISRIINRMGDFVHIFLTLFLTTRMGMDEKETGFFLMIVGFSRIAGVLTGGKLSDFLGRKMVIVYGQSLSALFLIPCGFLGNSIIIPYLMAVSGFFNGAVRPASGSMVADLAAGNKRKAAYSLMYLGTNIGVAVGPLIAGFLFRNHTRWIFWGDGATALLSSLLIVLLIKESSPGEKEETESLEAGPESEKLEKGSTFKAIMERPFLMIFSILALFCSALYSQHSFLIPLHLEILFHDDSARIFGYIMSFNAVTVLLMTSPLLVLTGKNSASLNTAIASFLYTAGFGMLYFFSSIPSFFISAFIWTVGEILMVTNFSIYIANHSPINHRGRFNSVMNTVTGTGFIIGPYFTGVISSSSGVTNTWIVVAVLGIFTGTALSLLNKSERNRDLINQLQ